LTFLNPAILWGLAAVSIPIIIHIFNLRKTKKIEFSTLMFLKEIQQSKYKKIKLKQLLILLCRIAMIIFLVLAFSRPFETGYLGAGEKARSSVLLILDNSFSMQTRAAGGSDFDLAKKKISETTRLLDQNDEVFFTTVSGINNSWVNVPYKNFNDLKDSVSGAKVSDVTRDLNEVLYYANKIISSASNPYKEIFLFTDGQKTFIEGTNRTLYKEEFDRLTNINFVLCGSRNANNISLDTINTVTKIFERNRNVKFKCTINNRNNFNVSNKSVILNFENGKYKDEKNVDIPSNSSVDVEFNFIPYITEFAGGYVEIVQSEIADDEIVNDNKRYFSFRIPDKINLLLVSSESSELDYIKLALYSSEELMRDSSNNRVDFFNIKQIDASSLSAEDLKKYDCVVLDDYPSYSSSTADMLFKYVQSGGGVIIYPGRNINTRNYNETLMKRFDFPPIGGNYGSIEGSAAYVFDKIDLNHPVFEGIFKASETDRTNITKESPKIKYGIELLSGNNTISLIRLNNEKSFLNEYSSGKGKIFIYSVSPDMEDSDFPEVNLFSPLTVRSILYLSNSNPVKEAVTGHDYFADLSSNLVNLNDTIIITDAQLQISRMIKSLVTENEILNFKLYLSHSSNYSLTQNGKKVFEFPSNFNRTESNTAVMDEDNLRKYLKSGYGIDINAISDSEPLSASILELRTGKEIWQYFLIAALLFLVAELIIARTFFRTSKRTIS
jgi:hypothetical protein